MMSHSFSNVGAGFTPAREKGIKKLLEKGVTQGVYPGAVLLVAHNGRIIFLQAVGHLSLIPKPVPMRTDTIFDLASLTKPLATTLAMMKMVGEGTIDLDQPLSELITSSPLMDIKDLTPRLLLSHAAGLKDWEPFYLDLIKQSPDKRKGMLREALVNSPLQYRPGKGCLYSDLGFMILDWIIEETTGITLPEFLDNFFFNSLSLKTTFFSKTACPEHLSEDRFAATEACPWRNDIVQGYVHDENAYALGGYSGHAGLFGVAEEVYLLIGLLRAHFLGEQDDYLNPGIVRTFFTKQDLVDGSTRALGWDTPSSEDSSSGKYFSPHSVGHLGFTGTSLWMDLEQDVIVIFLTNRIHPSRNNEKIKAFRPKIHDLIMEN
jgi:CubicO group peptidase (beta-lactamase class C family)